MKAQTSLPAAPPANTKVSAKPTVGRLAPWRSARTAGRSGKPMRVALSIMPIDSSTGKPKRLPPPATTFFSHCSPRNEPRPEAAATARKIATAAARPTSAHDREHRLPRQQHQHQRGRCRHRHLSDVAREIVGAERLHRTRAGEGARDQCRRQRMLRAGADTADQQCEHQGPEADAAAGDQIADARQRRADAQAPAGCRAVPRAARTESAGSPSFRNSRCEAGQALRSRCRTRPAKAAT